MPLSALILSCTLKPSPAESNTEALARVVADALAGRGPYTTARAAAHPS
jgi:hypothetical protein